MDTRNAHEKNVVARVNEVMGKINDPYEALEETLKWMDDQELIELAEHLSERFEFDIVKEVEIKLVVNLTDLQKQKEALLNSDEKHDGIIHFIDAIQDQIVESKQATEQEVFNLTGDE